MRKKKELPAPIVTGFLETDGKGGYQPASPDNILAAARDVSMQRMAKGTSMDSPNVARECLFALLGGYRQERFGVLFLDSQNRLIAYEEMFRGTLSSAIVHPREIVQAALSHHAASVILAHNHPSGSQEPSKVRSPTCQQYFVQNWMAPPPKGITTSLYRAFILELHYEVPKSHF